MNARRPRHDEEPQRQPKQQADTEPVLPEVSRDDRDEGWSEDSRESGRDREWYRRERPPHHE